MITRLRLLFATAKKQYIITGAPQCVVPDASMATMISKVKFDILWVQFYNTPACSARNWVNHNPNYASTGVELSSGFSYNAWATFLAGTASANAKLYIGIPGATGAAMTGAYLTLTELSNLVKAYYCKANFGGVMIWEATFAENNAQYYSSVKNLLTGFAANKALSCYKAPATSTSSKHTSTTSSKKASSTSSKHTSTTSSKKASSTSSKHTSTSSKKSSSTSHKTTSTAHTTTKSSSSSKRSSSTFHTTTSKK
jgi:chitinase